MRYVISDTHLGHSGILDYCNRPFDSVEEMDEAIVENWNNSINQDDTVIHLGDIRHYPSEKSAAEWVEELNGQILLIRGNHDDGVGQNAPYHTVQSCTIKHGRYTFKLYHGPEKSNYWVIHGHVHNSSPIKHPFIDPENKRVNVSCEYLNYTPLQLDKLVYYLEPKKRFQHIGEAERYMEKEYEG